MKLAYLRKNFYELLATAKDVDVSTVMDKWGENAIDDKINDGLEKVSEVLKSFDYILVDGLTAGTNRYGLTSNTISVKKVDIYRDGKLYCSPRPVDMAQIDDDDPNTTQQLLSPSRYSVSQMLYADGSTGLQLFLSPAPGWTESDALYTYVLARLPRVLSADGTKEVQVPPQIGMAALYWALYLASFNKVFAGLYEDSLTTYYRTGVVGRVYTKSDPLAYRPVRNPNDSSA